jgi:hypothetical protein
MWLAFYLVSSMVLAALVGGVWATIDFAPIAIMLLSGPALAAVILIYARLLGRLAWRLTLDAPPEHAAPHDREARPRKSKRRKRRGRRIQLQIPDDLSAVNPPAERAAAPRPRLDFHKRP